MDSKERPGGKSYRKLRGKKKPEAQDVSDEDRDCTDTPTRECKKVSDLPIRKPEQSEGSDSGDPKPTKPKSYKILSHKKPSSEKVYEAGSSAGNQPSDVLEIPDAVVCIEENLALEESDVMCVENISKTSSDDVSMSTTAEKMKDVAQETSPALNDDDGLSTDRETNVATEKTTTNTDKENYDLDDNYHVQNLLLNVDEGKAADVADEDVTDPTPDRDKTICTDDATNSLIHVTDPTSDLDSNIYNNETTNSVKEDEEVAVPSSIIDSSIDKEDGTDTIRDISSPDDIDPNIVNNETTITTNKDKVSEHKSDLDLIVVNEATKTASEDFTDPSTVLDESIANDEETNTMNEEDATVREEDESIITTYEDISVPSPDANAGGDSNAAYGEIEHLIIETVRPMEISCVDEVTETVKDRLEVEGTDANAAELEEDRAFLRSYIAEAATRLQEKAELRATNSAAAKERSELPTGKLDSSLKKNTAFIKKLRNFTESQYQSLSKEALSLNLSRYIGEAANALLECRLKMTDVHACVLLCSALHQRYAEFSPALLSGFSKVLKEKPNEKVSNLSKLRVDLRFFAELTAVAVFSQKEGLPLLGSLLMSLVNNDKKEHRNVSVIVSFCRFCGEDFMGLLPSKVDTVARALNMVEEVPRSNFLSTDRQKNVRQLMRDYYMSLSQHVILQYKLIQREERHNRRLLETRGEVEEARLAAVATEVAVLEKLQQHAAAMADYLQEQLPQLPKDGRDEEEGGLVLDEGGTIGSAAAVNVGHVWEDEDDKAFYTSLPELKALLPSILYAESEKTQPPSDDSHKDAEKLGDEDELLDTEEEEVVDASEAAEKEEEEEKNENENDEKGGTISNKAASQRLLFQDFLNTLPKCINRELIDNLALEFCLQFNTKPLRRKLARALFLVPRHRQDLLPFYGRLVAALKPLMPDLAHDLIERLKMDFRYQLRKKDQINLDSKLKVCRFIGELLKFGILPASDGLQCLRVLLADFKYHHVDMVCALLETAGRYLFRTPATHHRTKVLLDQMMRKKTALSFEPRYDTMITNAYYYVNPPERSQLAAVAPLPPMQQYIKHLIIERLNKSSVEKVLRLLRKLDWKDRETADYCLRRLSSPWEVKFLNIRCLANLVSGLVLYHDWIAPAVVDNVMEDIRIGLESNRPSLNQHRIASAKYLAELYNYKVIESAIIFKVLYCLISFGAGVSSEELQQELDPPEQLLRLRLVVTILDTCGAFFSSGHSKRKLDCFITYFQYYYHYKRLLWYASDSFPAEYDQVVRECLSALRPSLVLFDSFEQAAEALTVLNQQLVSKALMQAPELREFFPDQGDSSGLPTIAEHADDVDDDDDEDDRDRGYEDEERDDGAGATLSDGDEEDESQRTQDDSTQEDTQPGTDSAAPAMTLQPLQCQENDEFLSEFDRMMSDAFVEHSRDVRPNPTPMSLPLPTRITHKKNYDQLLHESKMDTITDENTSENERGNKTVKFILMSRSNKQQMTTIAIPEDSVIVAKMRSREKAEAEERRNVKRVTLEMTERQVEEEAAQELLMQQRNAPLNPHRERRVKYQHPKGAPDADLIFGSGKHRSGASGS